jgi:anti-sigma factor RsiW
VLDPARLPAVQRYLSERPLEAARVRAFIAQRDALRAALALKAEEPIPARLRVGHLRAVRRGAVLARWRVAAAAAGLLLAGASLGWTARGTLVLLRFVDAEGAAVLVWRQKAADPSPRAMRCADGPGGLVTYTWSNGQHLHAVTAALPRGRLRPIAYAVRRRWRRRLRHPPA